MEIPDGTGEQLRAGDHTSIEITHPSSSLVSSIKIKMEDLSSSVSIARVPEKLTKENRRAAYSPERLSIGPFHHGTATLKEMESQKWRYSFALLSRSEILKHYNHFTRKIAECKISTGPSNTRLEGFLFLPRKPNLELESTIDKCMKAVRELEHRARRCYSDNVEFPTSEFEEMLLVDGSFIIDLLIKYSNKSLRRRGDPIFGTPGRLYDLRCDMVLLENQIPMFVLQRLYQVVRAPEQCSQPLSDLVYRFFRNMIPGEPQNLRDKFNEEAHHFLDLIHNCLIPTLSYPRGNKPEDESGTDLILKRLKPARGLRKAGIKFKCKANYGSLLDIDFHNGILQIPPLVINQLTELLFRNLIALEQTQCVNLPCISSYACLIHSLVSSEKDEKLLEEVGIVTNLLGAEVKVSGLFRDFCEGVNVDEDFHYEGLCDQVEEYCETKKRKWKKLKRKQKNQNRREFIGLGSGSGSGSVLTVVVLILVFTFVGTIFSALALFLNRK